VRVRLVPQDTAFYDFFIAAGDNVLAGARLLAEIVDGPADKSALAAKVRDLEHANDEVTHRLMAKLNSTFVTPFDREDIYRLGGRLDDVMDLMEAAADLVVLYGLRDLPAEMSTITDVLIRCGEATADAMTRLRSRKELEDYWIRVNELENEADQVYRRLVARLFSGEFEALQVLKLKEVLDQLEAAADAFEHVADTVETISVKES
jgi:predicted phosphate transport protein (TIGR00153 family)